MFSFPSFISFMSYNFYIGLHTFYFYSIYLMKLVIVFLNILLLFYYHESSSFISHDTTQLLNHPGLRVVADCVNEGCYKKYLRIIFV